MTEWLNWTELNWIYLNGDSQAALVLKNPLIIAGDTRNEGLIPAWGRSLGGRHGNPLQYSCLEKIPWTKESGQLWFTGLQRVGHDWSVWLNIHAHIYLNVYPLWSCFKTAWKLNCSHDTTHWSLQEPCIAPGSSSWDMTLCLQLSILGSSSPDRTEITQLMSKLTQRRSVGEKRSDFFFARVLFI